MKWFSFWRKKTADERWQDAFISMRESMQRSDDYTRRMIAGVKADIIRDGGSVSPEWEDEAFSSLTPSLIERAGLYERACDARKFFDAGLV